MADVPHLAWPFRMGYQQLRQVEQDSIEDCQQSAYAYLYCPRGARPLNPDWGVEDPTFSSEIDGGALAADLEESEEGRYQATVIVGGPDGTGRAQLNVFIDLQD